MLHHVEIVYSDGQTEMYSLCPDDPVGQMRYKGMVYVRDREFAGKPDAVVPAASLDVVFPG